MLPEKEFKKDYNFEYNSEKQQTEMMFFGEPIVLKIIQYLREPP